MCSSLAAAITVVLFFAIAPAQAASERARHSSTAAKEKAAKKACITGDVKTGIDILGDLYVDSGDATYLFNQGRCYEQNRRLEDAIDRFREYLRKIPDALAKDKADANAHIADCEALLAKQSGRTAAQAPQAAPQAPPQPVLAPIAPAQVQPPVAIVPAQPLAPESDGRGLRIAGSVTTAAGLCAVGTGVVLAIKERSLTNEINTKYSQSKESTRVSYETWGYVSYGVGAAAIVGGAVIYYLGWRAGQAESANVRIGLLPTLTPDGMTFVMHGSF
jgi:tetratricopeptide (TPR) repeat protein